MAEDTRYLPGYWKEGGGDAGERLHIREEFRIPGVLKPEQALVLKVFHDRIVTTVEEWKGAYR